jgi:hypothetical protein
MNVPSSRKPAAQTPSSSQGRRLRDGPGRCTLVVGADGNFGRRGGSQSRLRQHSRCSARVDNACGGCGCRKWCPDRSCGVAILAGCSIATCRRDDVELERKPCSGGQDGISGTNRVPAVWASVDFAARSGTDPWCVTHLTLFAALSRASRRADAEGRFGRAVRPSLNGSCTFVARQVGS